MADFDEHHARMIERSRQETDSINAEISALGGNPEKLWTKAFELAAASDRIDHTPANMVRELIRARRKAIDTTNTETPAS